MLGREAKPRGTEAVCPRPGPPGRGEGSGSAAADLVERHLEPDRRLAVLLGEPSNAAGRPAPCTSRSPGRRGSRSSRSPSVTPPRWSNRQLEQHAPLGSGSRARLRRRVAAAQLRHSGADHLLDVGLGKLPLDLSRPSRCSLLGRRASSWRRVDGRRRRVGRRRPRRPRPCPRRTRPAARAAPHGRGRGRRGRLGARTGGGRTTTPRLEGRDRHPLLHGSPRSMGRHPISSARAPPSPRFLLARSSSA